MAYTHNVAGGLGVLSLAPAENARKPQCCHQLKENAHSPGARHRHTSDTETEMYESSSSDKISSYSTVVGRGPNRAGPPVTQTEVADGIEITEAFGQTLLVDV